MWERLGNLNGKAPTSHRKENQGLFYFDGDSSVKVLGPGTEVGLEPVESLEDEDKRSYRGLRRKRRNEDLDAFSDCE